MLFVPYWACSNNRAMAGDLANMATSILVVYEGFFTRTDAPYTWNPGSNSSQRNSLALIQQFHLRKARALRVGLPLGFFIGPFTPPILAQKLFLRLAALEPGLSFDGLVVTAICNLLPGFSLR